MRFIGYHPNVSADIDHGRTYERNGQTINEPPQTIQFKNALYETTDKQTIERALKHLAKCKAKRFTIMFGVHPSDHAEAEKVAAALEIEIPKFSIANARVFHPMAKKLGQAMPKDIADLFKDGETGDSAESVALRARNQALEEENARLRGERGSGTETETAPAAGASTKNRRKS